MEKSKEYKTPFSIIFAWIIVLISSYLFIGPEHSECVNGIVKKCSRIDYSNIVGGIIVIGLTIRYWKNIGNIFKHSFIGKTNTVLLDLTGIGLLITSFTGKCTCLNTGSGMPFGLPF